MKGLGEGIETRALTVVEKVNTRMRWAGHMVRMKDF